MTGNVDEWVVNESGRPYQSGLKGGYWGPVRTRCRPMTTAHNEDFNFYQIGFRCCGEVPGAAKMASAKKPAKGEATKSAAKSDANEGSSKAKGSSSGSAGPGPEPWVISGRRVARWLARGGFGG